MLIRFNVKNFLSFSERDNGKSQEFSMIAGKVRSKKEHVYDNDKLKLLKFAAVYGANASGKSNLVKAIDFMRDVVLSGLPKGHTDKFCKINPDNKEKESYFEIEIMIGEKYYAYGFQVVLSRGKIISEWLVELTPNNMDGKLIFSRDVENGKYSFSKEFESKPFIKNLHVYAKDVKNDSSVLFLNLMNHNKKDFYNEFKDAVILKEVYLWVRDSLDINYPNAPISDYSYMSNTENIEEVCRIISAFGTGITNFKLVDVPFEKVINSLPRIYIDKLIVDLEDKKVKLKNDENLKSIGITMRSNIDFFTLEIDKESLTPLCKTIQFSHENKDVLFNLGEESDGTIRILDLLEILISESEKTYVIDELDRCLHPSLTYKFVETFLQLASEKNIQLIVTTHESRLMDFNLLRRDEIWFVDKKKSGESDIYSLEEYNARFDKKIDKAYLEGRYGGVPIFSTVFPIKEG